MSSGDLEKQKDTPTPRKFAWRNISYTVQTPNGRRQILKNVSGHVKSGILQQELLLQ